jgi:hypothetical protein
MSDATFEGSGVQRLVREGPTEEDSTVLKMQAVPFLQYESYGLHRADTEILLPWFDIERRGKMTWMVCLGEAGRDEANEVAFPPEMRVVTQEGHKLLAVVMAIRNAPFRLRLERGRSTGQC